ncbi:MAG: type II toxin-antitoxin system VapC family toxin [Phycisphaerales bacterium]|nr:type II toxin-antitoxin system VapC family toxin [Phycisphaerales bacterium]
MALRLALDTNRYHDYVTGVEDARAAVAAAAEIHLPFIVVAEARCGGRHGSRPEVNERVLQDFIRTRRVNVLFADEATTHFYADLYAEMRRTGTPVPTNDLWIAALVIQHGLTLFTRDRHFERISRVPRI